MQSANTGLSCTLHLHFSPWLCCPKARRAAPPGCPRRRAGGRQPAAGLGALRSPPPPTILGLTAPARPARRPALCSQRAVAPGGGALHTRWRQLVLHRLARRCAVKRWRELEAVSAQRRALRSRAPRRGAPQARGRPFTSRCSAPGGPAGLPHIVRGVSVAFGAWKAFPSIAATVGSRWKGRLGAGLFVVGSHSAAAIAVRPSVASLRWCEPPSHIRGGIKN